MEEETEEREMKVDYKCFVYSMFRCGKCYTVLFIFNLGTNDYS